MAASPRRQQPGMQPQQRVKDPPNMVMQSDFRKVSGISTEIFRLIEQVENDHDATTAAALDTVDRRGEMVVRILDPRTLGRFSAEQAKKFLHMQDNKHIVQLVEIVKRPGQTLGLYIREGNGSERAEGVFISRIALESAVYNSGCLQVGDEILAVNLVDVTHMSLDDVVIIMSIPRRLVLVTRQRKGARGVQGNSPLLQQRETKQPPVVVIKKHFDEMDQENGIEDRVDRERERERDRERDRERERQRERERERDRDRRPRSRLGLGLSPLQDHNDHNGLDLYYNSRPSEMSSTDEWTYRPPPPPVVTEQPKPQHFTPYDRHYPNTLESLAEKVHSFYPGGPGSNLDDRRGSTGYRTLGPESRRSNNRVMPRSGSDQHLPRVEYDYGSTSRMGRESESLLRSSAKSNTLGQPGYTSRFGDLTRGYAPSVSSSIRDGSLSRRSRGPLDYSSDTEATIGPRSGLGYLRRGTTGLSGTGGTLSRVSASSLRSNSLPRDRGGGLGSQFSLSRYGFVDDDDGAISAPEMSSMTHRGRIPNSPSVFTSDEYRQWLSQVPASLLPRSTSSMSHTGSQGLSGLSRTPSTSAIYERIRAGRDALGQQRAQRFTFSAENLNLIERTRDNDNPYYSMRGSMGLSSTLDRPRPASTTPFTSSLLRSSSSNLPSDLRDKSSLLASSADKNMRRMMQLMELESRHIPHPTPRLQNDPRSRLVDINPAEFLKYKMEKPSLQSATSISSIHSQSETSTDVRTSSDGMYGLLWVHLLAGRGLRASTQTVGAAAMRDLYCVLECDRVHKARTVVRTGDIVFDWDETFELDLMGNRELDLLIYSWDPQYRHKLCYKGSVHLVSLLKQSPVHQLALKIEPRGTLYLRLKYTDPQTTFQRKPASQHILARPNTKPLLTGLFGTSLESALSRENTSLGGMSAQNNVPVIIKRCVEEIERRGLDIIGLYRLCGSATKKRILREALERSARTVDLTPDNVPDINVITGVLKDYLRELPEPLFTKCLYQMLADVMSLCLPDDPEGNARLLFSILDCLPKINRVTLVFLMDHLALVVSQSDRNKMTAQNISVIFGPILMLHAEPGIQLDFNQPVSVLKYLLEIWKHQSVRDLACPGSVPSSHPAAAQARTGGLARSTPPLAPAVPPPPLPPPAHPYTKPLPGVPGSKPLHGPVVVTSPGSPTSESSRSSSSVSPPEDSEVLRGKIPSNKSKLVDSASVSLLNNKSPSQISLLGSHSSIANRSPSQISLLGSNSSISSLARSNASISDQAKTFRSPYGSPNLSDRSKSPYMASVERSNSGERSSPGFRDAPKSPNLGSRGSPKMDQQKNVMPTSLTSGQICENAPTEPKPMFSTLPRQRSIPTIIGMPRRLTEQRKSLPQVATPKLDEFADIPKNPFEKIEDFPIPVNPSGKNPFLDEDDEVQYNYDNVMSRVMNFEQKTDAQPIPMYQTTMGQYGPVVTTAPAHKFQMPALQYSVPVSSGKVDPTPVPIPVRPPNGGRSEPIPNRPSGQSPGRFTGQNVGRDSGRSVGPNGGRSDAPPVRPTGFNTGRSDSTIPVRPTGLMSGRQDVIPSRPPGPNPVRPDPGRQAPRTETSSGSMRSSFDALRAEVGQVLNRQFEVLSRGEKTQQRAAPDSRLPFGFGQVFGSDSPMRPNTIREEASETPTPSSSTGTDSSRKDIGRDGDVESDSEDDEMAEQNDFVPELATKMY